MGAETEIAWCDHTFNPWWGCARVSPGCEHCYAETFAHRLGLKVWGTKAAHRRFGDKHWSEPLVWNRKAERDGVRRRVFCASMADVFEGRDEDQADSERLFRLVEATPALDWLLLTKRPEHMLDFAPLRWTNQGWPRNAWAGCTVEDQRRAEERIPHLLRVPAAMRFLSCEPLLGPVNVAPYLPPGGACGSADDPCDHSLAHDSAAVRWVIIGGESGPGARPFNLAWARSLVAQCRAAGVSPFVKQLGRELTGEWHPAVGKILTPPRLADPKGGDPDEWPEDLRVREWPVSR